MVTSNLSSAPQRPMYEDQQIITCQTLLAYGFDASELCEIGMPTKSIVAAINNERKTQDLFYARVFKGLADKEARSNAGDIPDRAI